MRASLRELCDKLGVGYIMSAYETCPWAAYDDEKGLTCNAEVRMDSDETELEAEMQLMRDEPQGDEKELEQIYWMVARPAVGDKWDIKLSKVKGETKAEVYDWDGKAAEFFHACVQELKMGKIPDFDDLIKKIIEKKDRFSDQQGSGSSKAPKIKPQQLMGVKSGM
ncbi:MAG: hypothetical protein AAF549_07690 [Pseudomonadota bacterium]